MRAKAPGRYTPLTYMYYTDDAIGAVGPIAELLYVRSLSYCADHLSDGFMTDTQVRRFVACGDIDDLTDVCKRLVESGLWDRDDERGGFQIRQWLKWNLSWEEITHHRSKDAARKRDASISDRSPSGIRAERRRNPSTKESKEIKDGLRPSPSGTDGRSPRQSDPPDLTEVRETISRAARNARREKSRPVDD